MNKGDTLELAPQGTYTIAENGNGLEGLPSGRSFAHTIVNGNGATITGGANTLYLLSKSYVNINDCNFTGGTNFIGRVINSDHITLNNCNFVSAAVPTFYDCLRIANSNDIALIDCEASAGGRDTSDGFELWGPCNQITFTRCRAYEMTGGETADRHGFEVYAGDADGACNDVLFDRCSADNCAVGFSCEGGPASVSHINVRAINCIATNSRDYDAQGISGSTLYVTADTLQNRGGSVMEL